VRVLFVTNGHGEAAIARRIAAEVRASSSLGTDHLALVGQGFGDDAFADVGPQRAMPSGGLVAMGNVFAFARDVAAGFVPHWLAQRAFLRGERERYAGVVAVGDVYALLMAFNVRRQTIFVGTAKSVYVARYGRFERRVLRRVARVFVRDAATAEDLRVHGIAADAPGNVIVDLSASDERFPWHLSSNGRIALLPGSRDDAYENAAKLGAILAIVRRTRELDVAISIAPGIDEAKMIARAGIPVRPWAGALGAIFAGATLALGQAGTANEAAAASGLPVVAIAERKSENWYRMRQRRLLGDALAILPAAVEPAASALGRLLDDAELRAAMGRIGRERMGGRGGAAAIARAVVALAEGSR
jgi:tetraacyldisaccharide 4'-kinase